MLRMENESNCRTALKWKPEGKRKVGHPRTTWRRTVESERKELRWSSWNEARTIARDRKNWKDYTAALWATGPQEDR